MRNPMKERKPNDAGRADRPRKVFVGFWTWPENRDALRKIAQKRRQSASAFIDEIVEERIALHKWGHR